mgnify:CR=1 FL=1
MAVAVALSVVVLPPPLAAQQRVPSSAAMLADAQRHFEAGRHAEVIEQLRTLRLRHPEAPELAPALLLAGRSALAMDSGYQARYLLGQALSAGGEGGSAGRVMREAATLLAELLTEQRDYCGALIHTEQALAVARACLVQLVAAVPPSPDILPSPMLWQGAVVAVVQVPSSVS